MFGLDDSHKFNQRDAKGRCSSYTTFKHVASANCLIIGQFLKAILYVPAKRFEIALAIGQFLNYNELTIKSPYEITL